MRVHIIMQGPEASFAATNLVTWLRGHPDVKRHGRAELAPPPEGSMGAVEVVTIVVAQLTAVANLASAYMQWRQAAHRRITGASLRVGDVEVRLDDFRTMSEAAEKIDRLLTSMGAVAATPSSAAQGDAERLDGTA
ncbi:hypothetical protein DDE19_13700 [Micromonospora ureilytica]|uniref:Uncharacterized protein n=1 Tax=Micromonospora ureilytica TaxID=709868 RepID=A0A3N9XV38_9ACTN|nr:hypothetical protein [Micromonospora ureilytica]RQX16824.1 hypothetical protein DDE19_13700 [Micromonospora ureilytica]